MWDLLQHIYGISTQHEFASTEYADESKVMERVSTTPKEAILSNTKLPWLLLDESIYVGDAAGRPEHGTRKKDFSDSDLKFAVNLGVKVCSID